MLITLLGGVSEAASAFDRTFDKSIGARAMGMGRALAGLADDASAVFINPAGLATVRNLTLLNMYSTPVTDSHLLTFAGSFPVYFGGTAGIGYNNITQSNVLFSGESISFLEQELVLFYANKLNEKLSVGGEFKYYSKGPSKDVSPDTDGSGYNFDLSLKYRAQPWLKLGANFQNIMPASLGGRINFKDKHSEELSAKFKLGLSAKLAGEDAFFKQLKKQELYFNLDVDKSGAAPTYLHAGAEWWPVQFFAIRGGIDQSGTSADESQLFTNISAGFGIKFYGITFDYAYFRPDDAAGRIEQYFSIGYIGSDKPKPATKVTTAETVPVLKRTHFNDVPASYWANEQIECLSALGLIGGFGDGTFRPDTPVSWRELAATLQRARPGFSPGLSGGLEKNVTRAEAVKVLVGFDGLSPSRVIEAPYADVGGRFWAAPYLTAAKEAGLIKFTGNRFEPKKELTRAELASLIYQTKFARERLKKYNFVL